MISTKQLLNFFPVWWKETEPSYKKQIRTTQPDFTLTAQISLVSFLLVLNNKHLQSNKFSLSLSVNDADSSMVTDLSPLENAEWTKKWNHTSKLKSTYLGLFITFWNIYPGQ